MSGIEGLIDNEKDYVDANTTFDLIVCGATRGKLTKVTGDYKISDIINLIKVEILNDTTKKIELFGGSVVLKPKDKLSDHGYPKPSTRANYVTMIFSADGGAANTDDVDVEMKESPLNYSHMTLTEASKLLENDGIDHRDCFGEFCPATILKKDGTFLRVKYDGYSCMVWSDYTKELHHFAPKGAITERIPHRLKNIEVGAFVDINPITDKSIQSGWRAAQVIQVKRGQVKVKYTLNHNQSKIYWMHLDNEEEIASHQTMTNSIWSKSLFEWTANDIKIWIQSVGTEMCKYMDWFKAMTGHQLALLQKNDLPDSMGDEDVSFIWSKILHIRQLFNITEQLLQDKQMKSMCGLIGLSNQGNTCFMNTSIQLILQTPALHQCFKKNSNNLKYKTFKQKQQSRMNPKRYGYGSNDDEMNISNTNMLRHFIELYNKSECHEYCGMEPASIFNRLCHIDSKYKRYKQQDAVIAMSYILQDIDDDLNNDKDLSSTSSIVVKQILTVDQEQQIVELLLKKHNPYNTLIRSVMDGVQRVISTCIDCNWQRIEYEIFRSIQLPLVNNLMTIDVDIWIPNRTQPIAWSFSIENYCKIDTLKYLIYKKVLCMSEMSEQLTFSMNNIIIGTFASINQWLDFKFIQNDSECTTLPSKVFATFKGNNRNTKLLHVFNCEINAEHNVEFISRRFVEIQINCKWNATQLNKVLCNDKNEYLVLPNHVLSPLDHSEYDIGSETNVIISVYVDKHNQSEYFPMLNRDQLTMHCVNDIVLGYNNTIHYRANTNGFVINIALLNYMKNISKKKLESFLTHMKDEKSSIETFRHILSVVSTQHETIQSIKSNFFEYISAHDSIHSKRKTFKTINNIDDCLAEYQRERVLDDNCSQMFCKTCQCNKTVFKENVSVVYSPLHLWFRMERRNKKKSYYNDKFNYLVKYPYGDDILKLESGDEYTLHGVGCHLSGTTLKSGHYISYAKSCYNKQWYKMSDSHINMVQKNNISETQNASANILMYTKKRNEEGDNRKNI